MIPSAENSANAEAASAGREKTRALLADLWRRNRPVIEERLAVLDDAGRAAATAGPMPEELREAALDAAHKLSGSLGMFGFDQGTLIARELEQMLDDRLAETTRLGDLANRLREMLLPPA